MTQVSGQQMTSAMSAELGQLAAMALEPHASWEPNSTWTHFVEAAARLAETRGAGGPIASDWRQLMMQMGADIRHHAYHVAALSVAIGNAMGLDSTRLDYLRLAALLHDVGKLAVPQAILDKAGPLSSAEWQIMRRHPGYARNMLEAAHARPEVVDAAYAHHERWDGTGYPRGLRGVEIPLSARIVALGDVVDALSSRRSYRGAWRETDVRGHVESGAGTQFDPGVVDAYLSLRAA
jgi:putative nucleotidyltransferase with HDIG domain